MDHTDPTGQWMSYGELDRIKKSAQQDGRREALEELLEKFNRECETGKCGCGGGCACIFSAGNGLVRWALAAERSEGGGERD